MAIIVNFSGTNYSIPVTGDESWSELTDYLVALSTAATTLSMTYSARIATTTPQSILPTDTIVLMNVGTPSVATLPVGVTGQFMGVYDFSGAGATNNITVVGSSGQLVNGVATYTISSNYGGALLQFNGVFWQIISESSLDVLLRTVYRQNNLTNASLVEGGVVALGGFVSVSNLQSCSFDMSNTNYFRFWISLSSGQGLICSSDFATAKISAMTDPNDLLLLTDAGVGLFVSKLTTSRTITVKNRTGGAISIEIHTETGKITSPTVWA